MGCLIYGTSSSISALSCWSWYDIILETPTLLNILYNQQKIKRKKELHKVFRNHKNLFICPIYLSLMYISIRRNLKQLVDVDLRELTCKLISSKHFCLYSSYCFVRNWGTICIPEQKIVWLKQITLQPQLHTNPIKDPIKFPLVLLWTNFNANGSVRWRTSVYLNLFHWLMGKNSGYNHNWVYLQWPFWENLISNNYKHALI